MLPSAADRAPSRRDRVRLNTPLRPPAGRSGLRAVRRWRRIACDRPWARGVARAGASAAGLASWGIEPLLTQPFGCNSMIAINWLQ
jgi:hypothetical protein